MVKPNIFEYDNYRKYLKDWFLWMKESSPNFSFRTFSMWAGFKSPNQLQLVFQGKRNITSQTLPLFMKTLKLKHREQKFFELLVNYDQAPDNQSKARYLIEMSSYLKKHGNDIQHYQFEYLTKWYFPVIRELVLTKDFKEDKNFIASRIGHNVTPKQVDEAIDKLLQLGLLVRDKNGKLIQKDVTITTGAESAENAVYFYHDQMIRLAHDALTKQSPNERNITGITFSCSKDDLSEISMIIGDCRKQILSYLENKQSKSEEDVCQVNFQLFRVTQRSKKERL